MGSFVPFGGFFSSPYDLKGPLSSSYHVNSSNQCNENSERQRSAFPRGGVMASVTDQHRPLLSPWLRMVEPMANNAYNDLKVCIISSVLVGLSSLGFRIRNQHCAMIFFLFRSLH